jgi:hypothetical protein
MSKKPAWGDAGSVLEFVVFLVLPRGVLADGLVVQEVVQDVLDGFLKAFLEFLKIFLVQENLMLVEHERTVPLYAALAFRDGKIKVVVSLRGLHVKEIRTLSGPDGFGVNVFRVALLGMAPFIIFVHCKFIWFPITNLGKLLKKH